LIICLGSGGFASSLHDNIIMPKFMIVYRVYKGYEDQEHWAKVKAIAILLYSELGAFPDERESWKFLIFPATTPGQPDAYCLAAL
jgi:hypothetical protein